MSQVTGYSRAQIALHWAVLLLMVGSYLTSEAMGAAWRALHDGRDAFGTTATAHVWLGIAILALVVIRLAMRLTRGAPALPPGGNPVIDLIARLTHVGLYLLLVLIPVSGLAAWFGGVDAAGGAHEVMFNLAVLLVLLHVVGAVYHQFILKDGLMERMKRAG